MAWRAVTAASAAALAVALPAMHVAAEDAPEAGSPCDRFSPGVVAGTVDDPALTELSGLVASHRHPGVLWTHNDSGHPPLLHAIAADGTVLGSHEVAGAAAVDWEDIAIGPAHGQDEWVLHVGDIGDNRATRDRITIHRVPEPATVPTGPGDPLTDVDTIHLVHPDGPVDAEALLIDPWTGDLVVLTKERATPRQSTVLWAPADALVDGAEVGLMEVDRIDTVIDPTTLDDALPMAHLVTGADVSPDGRIVLVRTYRGVLAFPRDPDTPLHAAFGAEPCAAPSRIEPQGEAIAFTHDGTAYLTVSEGRTPPLHRFEVAAVAERTPDPTPERDAAPGRPPVDQETRVAPPEPFVSAPAFGNAMAILAILAGVAAIAVVGTRLTTRLRHRR